MRQIKHIKQRFASPKLSNKRIFAALALAAMADALQIMLLPMAWSFAQSAVDVVAMLSTMWLIGFHFLLLPTFAIELIPMVDTLPTWTACVAAVVALHRKLPPTAQ